MVAVNRQQTDAQSEQIPPAIRVWAQRECSGVRKLRRFADHNERGNRGIVIHARDVSLLNVPDGWEAINCYAKSDRVVTLHLMEA